MKKLFILIPLLLIVFTSCNVMNTEYYTICSIDFDDNTDLVIISSYTDPRNYITNKVGTTITGNYFLIPESEQYIEMDSVFSTDTNIIEITNIDYDNQTFTAISKNIGQAKITVKTKNYGSSTSLPIHVINAQD